MQLVVHCPYGARINRGFGLALRKRLLRHVRLRAAGGGQRRRRSCSRSARSTASPSRRGPLPAGRHRRRGAAAGGAGAAVRHVHQPLALEPEPVADRAALEGRAPEPAGHPAHGGRRRDGRRVPPGRGACQENASGPLELPDHPIVAQTLHDTMTEALDLAGLRGAAGRHRGRPGHGHLPRHHRAVPAAPRDARRAGPTPTSTTPPPEERRTRAVTLRRGLPVDLVGDRRGRLRRHRPGARRGRARPPRPRRAARPAGRRSWSQAAEPAGSPCSTSCRRRPGRTSSTHDGRRWWVPADRLRPRPRGPDAESPATG